MPKPEQDEIFVICSHTHPVNSTRTFEEWGSGDALAPQSSNMALVLDKLAEIHQAQLQVFACAQFHGWSNSVEEVRVTFRVLYEPIF